jgi:proteasome lid subunit RPN8/RPN11
VVRPRSYAPQVLERIDRLAEADPGREVCGFVLARPGGSLDVVPIPNVADRYHERDARLFPRTARESYLMDPLTQLRVLEEVASGRSEVVAIFHSHVEAGAYFSAKDREDAVVDGVLQIPGAEHLVVSVRSGVVTERKRFVWDGQNFGDIPL